MDFHYRACTTPKHPVWAASYIYAVVALHSIHPQSPSTYAYASSTCRPRAVGPPLLLQLPSNTRSLHTHHAPNLCYAVSSLPTPR